MTKTEELGVKFTVLGPEQESVWSQNKVLLLTPHGANHHWLAAKFPQINDALTESYIKYLHIERDFGVNELARSLANKLSSIGFHVEIAETLYHRGILDGGRVIEHCIRNTLPERLNEQLAPLLLGVHMNATNAIKQKCISLPVSKGVVIDLHTMASFSPSTDDSNELPKYENILKYVWAYTQGSERNSLRSIDILTEDENGDLAADKELAEITYDVFKKAGHRVGFNSPYRNDTKYMMNQYFKLARGMAIDFPKHLLVRGDLNNMKLENLEVDDEKIMGISELLNGAIVKAFSTLN